MKVEDLLLHKKREVQGKVEGMTLHCLIPKQPKFQKEDFCEESKALIVDTRCQDFE